MISYQRDHYVETSELALPFIDDIGGTIRGYRVFTACRTVNGKIFRVDDHLDRLYRCAAAIYMEPPLPPEKLRLLLDDLVRENRTVSNGSDLLIDIIFSGGLLRESMKQSGKGAHLYIAVQLLVQPTAEECRTGVALATFPHQRMLPEVKLLNYIGAVVAHQTVVPQQGSYDVLFVDPTDRRTILEGSTFTVFFVDSQGQIVTPPLDGRILDSITRRVILQVLAPRDDLKLLERQVFMDEIPSFQEAFIASTTRGVLPVTRIDAMPIGMGKPGPVTKSVAAVFQSYLESY